MLKILLLLGIFIHLLACDANKGNTVDNKVQPVKVDTQALDKSSDTTRITGNDPEVPGEPNASLKDLPPVLSTFVINGYSVLNTTYGDLNKDEYQDAILILKKNGEETTSDVNDHPEKRPLLLLLGQADKTFKLFGKSDNIVYCFDCGGMMGDPFMNVVIKNGYFSVEQSGGSSWRWNRTTTFKYSSTDNNWLLSRDVHENYHSSNPGKIETKVLTPKTIGKLVFGNFDIYKE